MFTGLVTDVGTVRKAEHRNGLTRFEVESGFPLAQIAMGASILHSGVCLTVVDMGQGERGAWFAVEAVPETLSKTILGGWEQGTAVNLEQSLKLGDELGGHFVFGHVDGVGEIVSIEPEGQSFRVTIRPPAVIARYFATKGSAAVDGVSLTVAAALPNGDFQVAIIPHTWQVTTLGQKKPGDRVNLEIDMLARYVARMVGADAPEGSQPK
ncbi:riboflavin synthase [Hyphomonas sp. WL0036]|uniref:riboflavin synthase n=1 Tax=Hyphomonas sediminis TaxID=2866160 RepID=UPI001C810763|nr:riboflavin synthase [Hyphomonas sediminis]MBY9067877.1 riboflavin synthase [Hyphomonas sediminis]